MNIVLLGDSIFDNASYVGDYESVSDLIKRSDLNADVCLLAVDGDVTTDVYKQLERFPQSSDYVFVSCGGNDALRSISILEEKASNVGSALDILYKAKEGFRLNYVGMLEAILKKHEKVAVCTIYSKVPGLSQSACTALALFNEVILEELTTRNLPIIDLRVVFNNEQDYSTVSPIEPSKLGGEKIVTRISNVINNGFLSKVYV